MTTCHVAARAKLNLMLRVLAREHSGFHQIETLFCALELADEIEVSTAPDGEVHLAVEAPPEDPGAAPDLGPVEHNLAVRAVRTFGERTGIRAGARIRLVKRIPTGAGLGGGSSDAAAVLGALNRMHGEPLTAADLVELAGTLGSDVPFLACGAVLALAWGRGDRVAPLPPLPSITVLLAIPPIHIETAAAYRALAMERGDGAAGAGMLHVPTSWADVAAMQHNDFEKTVFAAEPLLRRVRDDLAGAGAIVARLTGSGSVVYGLFGDMEDAVSAAAVLEQSHAGVRTLLTRTAESL